jgi:hypothetical protein
MAEADGAVNTHTSSADLGKEPTKGEGTNNQSALLVVGGENIPLFGLSQKSIAKVPRTGFTPAVESAIG